MTEPERSRDQLMADAEFALSKLDQREADQVIRAARSTDTKQRQARAAQALADFVKGGGNE